MPDPAIVPISTIANVLDAATIASADKLVVLDVSKLPGTPAEATAVITYADLAAAIVALVPGGGGGGNTLLIGNGPPDPGLGVDGNDYLNRLNGDYYGPKTAGSWGSPVYNLTGESWFSTHQTVAIVSGVVTVDYTAGRLVNVPVNANITSFVINNFPADGTPGSLTFRFLIGAGGPFTIAFPSLGTVIRAEDGAVPVVPTTDGAVLMVTMFSNDARATTDLMIGASNLLPV